MMVPNLEYVDSDEDWIAEPVLWTPAWVHVGSLKAESECRLLMVSPPHFGQVITENPSANFICQTYARNFLQWLNKLTNKNLSDIYQGEDIEGRVKSFYKVTE